MPVSETLRGEGREDGSECSDAASPSWLPRRNPSKQSCRQVQLASEGSLAPSPLTYAMLTAGRPARARENLLNWLQLLLIQKLRWLPLKHTM